MSLKDMIVWIRNIIKSKRSILLEKYQAVSLTFGSGILLAATESLVSRVQNKTLRLATQNTKVLTANLCKRNRHSEYIFNVFVVQES